MQVLVWGLEECLEPEDLEDLLKQEDLRGLEVLMVEEDR